MKRQRLTAGCLNLLKLVKWFGTGQKAVSLIAVVGNQTDVESQNAIKTLTSGLVDAHCFQEDAINTNFDQRHDFMFNRFESIEHADCCILLGINPRTEAAVINARIRRLTTNAKNLQVFSIGAPIDAMAQHLGNNVSTLIQLVTGHHAVCKILATSKKPILICGDEVFKRPQKHIINQILNRLRTASKSIQIHYLHATIASTNAFELGIAGALSKIVEHAKKSLAAKNAVLFYFLETQNIKIKSIRQLFPKSVIIYQGCWWEENAAFADIIIPSTTSFEKTATYLNSEGVSQTTSLSHMRNNKTLYDASQTIQQLLREFLLFKVDTMAQIPNWQHLGVLPMKQKENRDLL